MAQIVRHHDFRLKKMYAKKCVNLGKLKLQQIVETSKHILKYKIEEEKNLKILCKYTKKKLKTYFCPSFPGTFTQKKGDNGT